MKLSKPLKFPEESAKSITKTSSLAHADEKNSEDLPNNLILEGLNHKVESLYFPIPIIYEKEHFFQNFY